MSVKVGLIWMSRVVGKGPADEFSLLFRGDKAR